MAVSAENRQAREKTTLRLVALAFFVLSIYVFMASVVAHVGYGDPGEPLISIAVTTVSVLVMPLVSKLEWATGKAVGLGTLSQTLNRRCFAYLSTLVSSSYWADGGLILSRGLSSFHSHEKKGSMPGKETFVPAIHLLLRPLVSRTPIVAMFSAHQSVTPKNFLYTLGLTLNGGDNDV